MNFLKKNIIWRYIILFFILSLVLIIGVFLVYASNKIIGYAVYQVDYSIGDYAGVNLDSDAIHFGIVMPGTITKRTLRVATSKNANIDINLNNLDNIMADKDYFFLEANQSENVVLSLFVPLNAVKGNHSGKLVVMYYNPK